MPLFLLLRTRRLDGVCRAAEVLQFYFRRHAENVDYQHGMPPVADGGHTWATDAQPTVLENDQICRVLGCGQTVCQHYGLEDGEKHRTGGKCDDEIK